MKKIYSIGFFCALCLFAIGFYVGYQKMHVREKEEPELVLPEQSLQQTQLQEEKTTCDTIWIIQKYDQAQNTTTNEILTIPAQYIDQSREQIEKMLEDYQKAPVLSDLEQGFLNIALQSFSAGEVIILKTYDSSHKNEGYYLLLVNGKVCVYLYDRKTLYFTTELLEEELPETVRKELIQGKYFENENRVYSFLESYTS